MGCEKKRYITKADAKADMKRLNAKHWYSSKLTDAYFCEECKYYHLTTLPVNESRDLTKKLKMAVYTIEQEAAKAKLQNSGWICLPCNCPGAKRLDCDNKQRNDTRLKLKKFSFNIYKDGRMIEQGQYSKFTEVLNKNGIVL